MLTTDKWDILSHNLQHCLSSVCVFFVFLFFFFSFFCPVIDSNRCLCSSRFRGVGSGREGKLWRVLAIHVWSKSRYIECVILASLYFNGSTDPPSFLYFLVKNPSFPDAHLWKVHIFSPHYDRYMSILHRRMPLAHPPPRPHITFSYRIIYLSPHKKLKSNTRSFTRLSRRFLFVPVRPLPHSLLGAPAKVCVYFFIFSLIYCHIHISCILLHCYCTGPDYSGGVKRREQGAGFGAGEENKGKRKQWIS